MSKTLTAPLKWHGGKSYLAGKIIEQMPARCRKPNAPEPGDDGWLHYVEPFFGGGAVMLANNPEGISEVANDLNRRLSEFWAVLQSENLFAAFEREVQAVPFSQHELAGSGVDMGPVHNSVNFFIRCRQSLSGRMGSFAGITRNRTRRGMNEQVSAWLGAIEGLPAVHERLKRVLILNKPAVEVIRSEDGPRTLFYLDPPYLHETRVTTGEYEHEMTETQHFDLLKVLGGIKGRFILSGYRSAMYDADAERFGWRRVDIEIDNKSSSAKSKPKKTECLWFNYAASAT